MNYEIFHEFSAWYEHVWMKIMKVRNYFLILFDGLLPNFLLPRKLFIICLFLFAIYVRTTPFVKFLSDT